MAKKKVRKNSLKRNLGKKSFPNEKTGLHGISGLFGSVEEQTSLRKRGFPSGPLRNGSIVPPTKRRGKVKVKITPAAAKRRKATDALIASNKSTPAQKAKRVAAFKAKAKKKKGKK